MSVMSVISVISVNVTLNVTFWWSHVHTSLRNSNVVFQVLKKKCSVCSVGAQYFKLSHKYEGRALVCI